MPDLESCENWLQANLTDAVLFGFEYWGTYFELHFDLPGPVNQHLSISCEDDAAVYIGSKKRMLELILKRIF